jgi:hypothetical protein
MRLRIEYGDKNERIAARFPLAGEVESTPRCADSALVWHLVRLDASIEDRGTEYSHLLIASRWRGRRIGDADSVSVFLLGVPASRAPVCDGFSCRDFTQLAWGMAHVLHA